MTCQPVAFLVQRKDAIPASELFKVAVEASPCGVLMARPTGMITLVNRSLEEQFRYAREELIGQSVEVLVPECLESFHVEYRLRCHDHPQTCQMGGPRELFGRRKDGSCIPLEIALNAVQTATGPFVLASILDLSERRRHDDEFRRALDDRLHFERLLADVSAKFVNLSVDQIDNAIQQALGRITEAFSLDRGVLFQLSQDSADLISTHHWARVVETRPTLHVSGREQLPWSRAKILRGEMVLFSSINEVPDAVEREALRRFGTKSRAAIPLLIGGQIAGVIAFVSTSKEYSWPEEIVNRLSLVAQLFANALARKQTDIALRNARTEIGLLREPSQAENGYLRREVRKRLGTGSIFGQSTRIRSLLEQIEGVAGTNATVLLLGETGTGKELFATHIHDRSPRCTRPIVRVNCSAIPTTLIESELFGREKGAFTGALAKQIGRFELADHSTSFLDEIGDLAPDVQVKLLRVLEEREIERLGSPKRIQVDTRVIAATHRNLEQMIEKGTFREDLYYRLNVFPIRVPPLRDRVEDIPLLVWRFVQEFGKAFGKTIESIDNENMTALQQYSWPGNIRELRNVVERAMITATGCRLKVALPQPSASAAKCSSKLVDVERDHIRTVLENSNWRIRGSGGAANRLGMKPTTLESRVAKLGLTRPLQR